MRTTPMPARDGAVASATMVSVGENTITDYNAWIPAFAGRTTREGREDDGRGPGGRIAVDLSRRDVRYAAPRTRPIGVSLQNASQGPKAGWGDAVATGVTRRSGAPRATDGTLEVRLSAVSSGSRYGLPPARSVIRAEARIQAL